MSDKDRPAPLGRQAFTLRVLFLVGLAVVGVVVMLFLEPMRQSQRYHDFKGEYTCCGIDRFPNVVSNLPFLVVGSLGMWFLFRTGHGPDKSVKNKAEWWSYFLLFLGISLTTFGSTYYHLEPSNQRLAWDRLPMSLAFMALLAALISERIGPRAGGVLLLPLVAIGIGSVIYWHITEQQGRGDLRPYFLVQGYPLLAIVLIPLLFPARYTRTLDLYIALGLYLLAKTCEFLDGQIYAIGNVISGHTLKHLIGAAAIFWLLRMLWLRKPLQVTGDGS